MHFHFCEEDEMDVSKFISYYVDITLKKSWRPIEPNNKSKDTGAKNWLEKNVNTAPK